MGFFISMRNITTYLCADVAAIFPKYENTGKGLSLGCSNKTLKLMLRPSKRGGVPVFKRLIRNGNSTQLFS